MARGIAGTCLVCDLPPEKAWEMNARIIRGDSWDAVAALVGCTHMTIKRHTELGHLEGMDLIKLRLWLQQNDGGGLALEKARIQALEQPKEVTQEMVNATLLSLAQHGMRLLNKMEDQEDYRGSIAAVESLRRTAMDLVSLNGLKGNNQAEAVDSVDVEALRSGILDLVRTKTPGALPR